jgi:hypothetical protein
MFFALSSDEDRESIRAYRTMINRWRIKSTNESSHHFPEPIQMEAKPRTGACGAYWICKAIVARDSAPGRISPAGSLMNGDRIGAMTSRIPCNCNMDIWPFFLNVDLPSHKTRIFAP